jgi:hypothetical protein
MAMHKITEFYTKWFNVCPNVTSKFRTIAMFKTPTMKIMAQMKLVGMSMTFSPAGTTANN